MQVEKIQVEAQLNRNSESLFLLKRSDNSSTCGSVQVNFSPIPINLADSTSLDVEKYAVKSYPVFNTDRRFYTPCFILEVDKSRYAQNQVIYYSAHEKKIAELCEQKTIICVPKPPKNNSICCICKVVYDDYLTHVTNPQHKNALIKSQFTRQILNLCHRYNGQKEIDPVKGVKKQIAIKQKKITKESVISKKPYQSPTAMLNLAKKR